MPAALSFPIGNRFYDWKYESEPEPNMHGRRIYHARGKVLGGSSSINGMIFQRGNPMDYERWGADPGMESWDYAHCLPYFKRMETCLAGADEWRGGRGPTTLSMGARRAPALRCRGSLSRGRRRGVDDRRDPTARLLLRQAKRWSRGGVGSGLAPGPLHDRTYEYFRADIRPPVQGRPPVNRAGTHVGLPAPVSGARGCVRTC
jgi:choline dehydrogenase-like flavoprotein